MGKFLVKSKHLLVYFRDHVLLAFGPYEHEMNEPLIAG